MAKLVQGSIARHLFAQTWPMVLGIAALISVGVVDAYFVGKLGPDPLAAISFIFPITVALSSLGVGVMVGINSVMARALGQGDLAKARHRGQVGLVLALGTGVIIAALLLLLQGPLFRAMNASDDIAPLIESYMTPFALGFPIMLTAQGLNGGLRAQGAALRSSAILFTIALANWVLDPLLIAGWGPFPAYGVAGAAYASVGAFVAAGVVGFALVQTSELPLHFERAAPGEWMRAARDIARVGGPAALANAVNPIGLSVLTGFLAVFGNDAVAGFGAAGRAQTFAVVPLLALSSSIGSIVGQNWGASSCDRAWRALVQAGGFACAYGLVVAVLLAVFSSSVGRLFTDDPTVLSAIETYLRIAAWGYAGYGVLIIVNGALNAIDHASVSMTLAIARVAVVMLPVAYLGGHVAGGGAPWVYAGELAANLVGGVAAATAAYAVMRRR